MKAGENVICERRYGLCDCLLCICNCCSGVERQHNRVAGCDGIATGWMDEYLPCRIFSVGTQSWLDVQH